MVTIKLRVVKKGMSLEATAGEIFFENTVTEKRLRGVSINYCLFKHVLSSY